MLAIVAADIHNCSKYNGQIGIDVRYYADVLTTVVCAVSGSADLFVTLALCTSWSSLKPHVKLIGILNLVEAVAFLSNSVLFVLDLNGFVPFLFSVGVYFNSTIVLGLHFVLLVVLAFTFRDPVNVISRLRRKGVLFAVIFVVFASALTASIPVIFSSRTTVFDFFDFLGLGFWISVLGKRARWPIVRWRICICWFKCFRRSVACKV